MVFVCQPGKDELDETILHAISSGMSVSSSFSSFFCILSNENDWSSTCSYKWISVCYGMEQS